MADDGDHLPLIRQGAGTRSEALTDLFVYVRGTWRQHRCSVSCRTSAATPTNKNAGCAHWQPICLRNVIRSNPQRSRQRGGPFTCHLVPVERALNKALDV